MRMLLSASLKAIVADTGVWRPGVGACSACYLSVKEKDPGKKSKITGI